MTSPASPSANSPTGSPADIVTPSQTVGPFFGYALPYEEGPHVVAATTPGAVQLHGRVFDGNGEPVPDALLEVWQLGPQGGLTAESGIYSMPGNFRGFGRCGTDDQGRYWFRTVKPYAVPTADGQAQAPHLAVTVFARGLLRQLYTRIYFPDEAAANRADPLLSELEPARRDTLIATAEGESVLLFNVYLQDHEGEKETVFLDVFG